MQKVARVRHHFICHMLLTEQRGRMWAAQGHCGTSDTALWESMMKCHVSTYTLFVSMRGQSAHKTPKAHYGSTFCILALFIHTVSVPVSHPEREADWHECLKLNALWHTLNVHRISRIADGWNFLWVFLILHQYQDLINHSNLENLWK